MESVSRELLRELAPVLDFVPVVPVDFEDVLAAPVEDERVEEVLLTGADERLLDVLLLELELELRAGLDAFAIGDSSEILS